MKYIVIYNPLSNMGKKKKIFLKLAKTLKIDQDLLIRQSIIDITNINTFFDLYSIDDMFIVVGGDGTINSFANLLGGRRCTRKIYLYQAGTGNDFARSLKTKEKLIPLTNYLYNLPVVTLNDQKTIRFINGIGFGVDGMVCHKVNHHTKGNKKLAYFRLSLKSMKESSKFSVTINKDNDESINIDNVWFVSVMNSAYFGGGMKIAPKAKREDDELTLVVVKDFSKMSLPFFFPTIYLGLHRLFKKRVLFFQVKKVTLKSSTVLYAQVDGDDYIEINKITVTRKGEEVYEKNI